MATLQNDICMDIHNRPWAAFYDCRGDGVLGVDDLKAYINRDFTLPSIDSSQAEFDKACQFTKLHLLGDEVRWKLQSLLAGYSNEGISKEDALQSIKHVESDALNRWEDLLPTERDVVPRSSQNVQATIREMALRAEKIILGDTTEPYGLGVGFAVSPSPLEEGAYTLIIQDIHPASAAMAAGLERGNIIWKINGRPANALEESELSDPETQQVKGFSGPKDSNMELTVLKCGFQWPVCDEVTVHVKRNIWSARHLATPSDPKTAWTGTENTVRSTGQ